MSDLLKELAKAKAVFQQRAVKAILEQHPFGNNKEQHRNDATAP